MPVISLQHTYIIFRGWKKFELLSRHYSPMKCLIAAKSKTQSSKNTNSLFQIPEAPTIARYQLGVDRGTSPIVFLSKMLIADKRVHRQSVCYKRKLKKETRQRDESHLSPIWGTSPIVSLFKMLIRGAPRILGQSVCNKRKLKKDQRDKSPSLSLQDADKRLS